MVRWILTGFALFAIACGEPKVGEGCKPNAEPFCDSRDKWIACVGQRWVEQCACEDGKSACPTIVCVTSDPENCE